MRVIPLIVASFFIMSVFDYGSSVAWAQMPMQGTGQRMQGGNFGAGLGGANPCFHGGTHRTHTGQHGNQTNYMNHQFVANATWMKNGTHNFGQYGNHTGFKMHPCTSQNSTSTSSGNVNPPTTQSAVAVSSSSVAIPSWVRNNAKWWSQNQMGDSDFIQGMQYLLQQGILKIPTTTIAQTSSSQSIPAWVKTNAGWWAQGQISDSDFIKGIQYLVSNGIVKLT